MAEAIYCEFSLPAAVAHSMREDEQATVLAERVNRIRQRATEIFADDRLDAGPARASAPRSIPVASHVEWFFPNRESTDEIARFLEREAEEDELRARIDLNTRLLQRYLDVVAFAADPAIALGALRERLPSVPISFLASPGQWDEDGLTHYHVIAHNVRMPAEFDDRSVMAQVDRILADRLAPAGGYRRVTR